MLGDDAYWVFPSGSGWSLSRTNAAFFDKDVPVNLMIVTLPTLTVTAIYYCWRVLYLEKRRRDRVLHERVAYMLWTMALSVEEQAA